MSPSSKRGRPAGSSRLNGGDAIKLALVADRLVREPNLRLTAAMRLAGFDAETEQRRLRRKWHGAAEGCMSDARQRRHTEGIEALNSALRQSGEMLRSFQRSASGMQAELIANLRRWADANPETVTGLRLAAEKLRDLQRAAQPRPL